MPEIEYERAGTVTLDGKSYQLVRTKSQQGEIPAVPYKVENSNEPPWEFRLPDILSEKSLSWDQGGFKSYQGVEQVDTRFTILPPTNVSEYGINTDGRWPRRLVPGPAINSYALAGNTSSINWIFSGPGINLFGPYATLYAVAGNNVYMVGNSNGSIPAEVVFSLASNPPIMGVTWQGSTFITTTDGTIYKAAISSIVDQEKVPSGVGTTTNWTPSAGANYTTVDETIGATNGDTDYVSSSTAGHIDLYNMTDYSLTDPIVPIGGIVSWAILRRTSTGGTTPVMRGVCRIGGVNYFSSMNDAIQNDTSFHTHTFSWAVNPATGLQWDWTSIDAAEFGFELQTAPGAGAIRVTTFSIFAGRANWTSNDAKASWLAVGPRRLFKIYNNSGVITLKNIAPSITETTEANWGDDVIIPGYTLNGIKCPLVAFQKTAIVATDKGIHGVDDDGTGIKIIERMDYSIQTMKTQDPYLYISHGHGVSRWLPGLVQSCGIEQEIENESVVKGTVTALAFLGKWTFAAITPPTGNNQILIGRERDSDDNRNYGPMVWDTLIETGNSETIYCLATQRTPTLSGTSFGLFFEYGNNLGYCSFPETGGIPEIDSSDYTFVTTGIRYTPRYKFRDVRDKYFYKILVRGKNNTASIYWEIAYKIDDEASWHTSDINSTNMRINADTLFEFKLPVTTTGQYIQFRFTYTSNSASSRSWINYFEVMAIPQGHKIQDISMVLLLADNIQHYDMEIETRDVNTQLSDLQTLMSSPSLILAKGPFNDTSGIYLMPRDFKTLQITQQDAHEPEHTVQVTFRVIE